MGQQRLSRPVRPFIDRDSIGFKVIGAMPKRSISHQTQGRMPALGWVRNNQWNERLPYSDNPEVINLETGIIGNTNNKTTDADFPNHVSFEWGDSQRINRLKRLMEMRKVHTRESLIEAQLDTVSFTAQSLLPLIGKELWFMGEAGERGTLAWQRTTALSLLADWNGEMNEHLPEPLIYSAWLRAIQTRLIRDELGPLAEEFTHVEPLFIERVYRDIEGASVWCDVSQAIVQAVGDKKGINRYGSCLLPMDDALVRAALDISARPFLVFNVDMPTQKIGNFDTELVREFFQALSTHAGLSLHIDQLHGLNSHHIAEAAFKSVARALRQAVEIDPRMSQALPSTKGAL